LWSRSIPRFLRSVVTSVKLDEALLMVYLLWLLRNAVRATIRFELGTTSNASGPGYMPVNPQDSVQVESTDQIDDLTEVDLNRAEFEVRIVGRVVYKLREFALAHLRRPVSEHEQERIDRV
jgi:hypothetical protein